MQRLRILVRGGVQGVGFRPFVYRLATGLELSGWVCNSGSGVTVEIEGGAGALEEFAHRLVSDAPPSASPAIESIEDTVPLELPGFEIRHSLGGSPRAVIQPDLATCGKCMAEVLDPANRRYLYPFTNCTNCGPRYSIILSLPYDRSRTTMSRFRMCEACREEYENPLDRRFHAQPNACPACGPKLTLLDASGTVLRSGHEALKEAAAAIRGGSIVAVKGVGGFHLMASAGLERPLTELRARKRRPSKPFALMVPDMGWALRLCDIGPAEERLLGSPQAPIVLLRRMEGVRCPDAHDLVAPGNPTLGIMLPHSPHQHLLMRELGVPAVATSGNLSEEPVCTGNDEALSRLAGVADLFLVHDRPIARHLDDSIACVIEDGEMLLRRSRGYAPLPVRLPFEGAPVLAVGGHMKNTVTLAVGDQAVIGQHTGDMDTVESVRAFRRVVEGLCGLYGTTPAARACDMHPDYFTTREASASGECIRVQHHAAHILSCMAENALEGPVLGVAWDGTGYGPDGSVWGGEFIMVEPDGSWRRVAHLRQFGLPGGDAAVREPRRSALGVMTAITGSPPDRLPGPASDAFGPGEVEALAWLILKGVNSPLTSSCGRLFDAVASLAGICHVSDFEGQAAMALEFAAWRSADDAFYEMRLDCSRSPAVLDWEPAVRSLIDDLGAGREPALVSRRFHNSMIEGLIRTVRHAGTGPVVLTGGCFQNRLLLSGAIRRLREEGFEAYRHVLVPTNDGGISLGQALGARLALRSQEE